MVKGVAYEGVMHTPVGICQIEPARDLWLEWASERTEESFRWCSVQPGTVGMKERWIEVLVGYHIPQPTIPEEGGE